MKISESSGVSANIVWTNYLDDTGTTAVSRPGTSSPLQASTVWKNSLNGYKFSVHYEYFPSIFGNKFYALIGPAFQSERYRAQDVTNYPSFGYDATTVGIDTGVGVRNFFEKIYVGVGIVEHFRPLKRLYYKNVNERPSVMAGERLQSPDSIRYKILSLQCGMRF